MMINTKPHRDSFSVIDDRRGRGIFRLACALAVMGVAPVLAQVSEIVVHNFNGTHGANPYAGIVSDSAGNLYGTTYAGGAANAGVVYKLDAAGNYTVLYTFTDGADGGKPFAGVTRDSAGNLYGATDQGGTPHAGVVYKLDAAGNYTVLHTFTYGTDGGRPDVGVILDPAGNLYGTTGFGGGAEAGVVYEVDTSGNETVLYTFTGGSDGSRPAGVIRDSAGNLYGATALGGTAGIGSGVVYKLDAAGNQTVLYTFTGGSDGLYPFGGVIRDSAGNLYGTTQDGGTGHDGVVYAVDTAGHERVLHSFTGMDGALPEAGVTGDSAGNLYGTTSLGGTANAGVVYKLDAAGNYTVLYNFTGGADGAGPNAGVILGPGGNLWGTTTYGGKYNDGVVFVLRGVAAQ
jgi:uncharacterized repeat protein (TIGR03803 family)